jgi:ribosomal protein S18 acetylase RimI-like enzyme
LIRRLGPDEWELLRDVRLHSLLDAPDAFASTHEREAGFGEAEWSERVAGNAWFIAVAGQSAVGIVAGRTDPNSPVDQRHLIAMWVAESARGSTIAIELVEAVADWAAADGATELTLGVIAGNERAKALYRKCGFLAIDEHFVLDGDSPRRVDIYRRDLTA